LRYYRNAKGQPTNDRILIGKLDRETGKLIPNSKYWELYDTHQGLEILPSYDSILSIGTSFLVGNIMESLGLDAALDECLGKERSLIAKTAALYMVARGNVFEGVLDYCEGYTISEKPLTSQSASEFFSSITYDERMTFFRQWVAKQRPSKYLAYDVTSFSTYAKDIIDSEWGYNRDGDRLPQINLGCFLSEVTELPVFYVTYPGSIVDKSHLKYMMAYNDELRISDVGFVLDRGFCSTANIKFLANAGFDYIIGVEKRFKTTRAALDLARDGIVSMRNRTVQGVYAVEMKGCFYGTTGIMHIYYDPELAERQRRDLLRKVESQEETLSQIKRMSKREARRFRSYFSLHLDETGSPIFKRNYDMIEAVAKNCGFFCLLTNTNMDSSQVLAKYRRKDVIEKGFDDVKNHIDMKRLRTHNTKTTDGKLFCAFISLIVASEIGVKLRDLMRKRSWSKDTVIRELEKIRVVTAVNGKRLMNPLTKTQRTIISTFGLGDEDLKAYITNAFERRACRYKKSGGI
jgi:transposase